MSDYYIECIVLIINSMLCYRCSSDPTKIPIFRARG